MKQLVTMVAVLLITLMAFINLEAATNTKGANSMKQQKQYTKAELDGFTLEGREGEPALTELAKDHGVDPTLKKDELVAAVFKAQSNTDAGETNSDDADQAAKTAKTKTAKTKTAAAKGGKTAKASTAGKKAETDRLASLDAARSDAEELLDELAEEAKKDDPTLYNRDPGAKAVVTDGGKVEMRDRHVPPPNRPSAVDIENRRNAVNKIKTEIDRGMV